MKKKLFFALALLAAMACQKENLESVQIKEENVTQSISEPIVFASLEELQETLDRIGKAPEGVDTKAEILGSNFASYAETVMEEDGYDDKSNTILSEAFGSILNQDGEVIFGDTFLKVCGHGILYCPVGESEQARELASGDIVSLCNERSSYPAVSDEEIFYRIKGYENIVLCDTFGLLEEGNAECDEQIETRANVSGLKQYNKSVKDLFKSPEPDAVWDNSFVCPKASDQKVKFSNDKYCNDTKIYHQNYGVASGRGIKTKTMKKGMFWNKFTNPIETGILALIIEEAGTFPTSGEDINKVEFGDQSYYVKTVQAGSMGKSQIILLTDNTIKKYVNNANSELKAAGLDYTVKAVRFVLNEDEAITRFPNKTQSSDSKKIDMNWIVEFGGSSETHGSVIGNKIFASGKVNKFKVASVIMYGKSIRDKEERGSALLYNYYGK